MTVTCCEGNVPSSGPATCALRYQAELARLAHTQNRIFIFRHQLEPLPVSKARVFWLQICRTRRVRGGYSWGRGLLMGCVGTLKGEVGIPVQRCKICESRFLELIRQLCVLADHLASNLQGGGSSKTLDTPEYRSAFQMASEDSCIQ